MNLLLGVVFGALATGFQAPGPATGAGAPEPAKAAAAPARPAAVPAPPAEARVNHVQFDQNGWPIVPDVPAGPSAMPPAAPAGEVAPRAAPRPEPAHAAPPPPPVSTEPHAARSAPLASGMDLGSPLLDVFQYARSPGAFKALAGRTVWWRVTIYGAQGEKIGVRELTHTADCAFGERDRLEHEDQRVYGRSGASVFAERQGMPWPTLNEAAGHELALFGLHLRLPWCFADAVSYAVVSRGVVDRPDERLQRIVLERRPPSSLEVVGPEADPRPRDRFELLYEPSTGMPREFAHRFASSGQQRRVLLEDWREHDGVRLPFRRVYVDEDLRQTTTLEILKVDPARVGDRDFRLH